jgi:hypothetical protein
MGEVNAFRLRLMQRWHPPSNFKDPEEIVVVVRIQLNRDGTLAAPPTVVSNGRGPLYAAAQKSALLAVTEGQPFDMFRPENYDSWKDMEVVFDPREAPKR